MRAVLFNLARTDGAMWDSFFFLNLLCSLLVVDLFRVHVLIWDP